MEKLKKLFEVKKKLIFFKKKLKCKNKLTLYVSI